MQTETRNKCIRRKEVSRSQLNYPAIFLLIILFTLMFIVRHLNTINKPFQFSFRRVTDNSTFTVQTASPVVQQHGYCSFEGPEVLVEDALEVRLLLASMAWPESPNFSTPPPLERTSDPVHSCFKVLPAQPGEERHVGDQLKVQIQMRDCQGSNKHYGGDFLLARLHNPELGAGVAGQVVDHLNGSYSAIFPLPWEGRAQVEVMLVHPSEAVSVLHRLTSEQPNRILFQSRFRSGLLSETTVCNVCLPNNQPLCNYTDHHLGDPWYCYRPKKLSCESRINHSSRGFNQNITFNEKKLFKSKVNMKVSINASGPDNVHVLPKKNVNSSNINVKPVASGYYYQDVWQPLDGTTVRQFNKPVAIIQCLTDKVVHLYGDSTIRQWYEHLMKVLPDLKEFNLNSSKQAGPSMAKDSAHNIMVKYRCHGPPIRFREVPTSQLRYIANELEGLEGGPHSVVVLGIWSHFSTFPVTLYIHRLRGIRRAVVRLLDRAPGTRVVIRTANLKALTLYESLTNSDWYSLQRDKVLRAMFRGLNVHLVDAWQMTLAHNLPHSLHPQPPIIKNMINVLLSYICPNITKKND